MTTTLITGSNKGLGREAARRLLAQGHDVWVAARDPQAGEEAAADLGVRSLRDATPATLAERWSSMDDVVRRRARHVVTENARVLELADALRSGDRGPLGALLAGSHESLRTDFEVSSPDAVFDGDIDAFLDAGIRWRRTSELAATP